MLLAIDVRNTHTVVGLIAGADAHAKVVQNWRIRTEAEVTSDELALTIDGLIGDDSERLTGAAALSTVPSALHEVREMLNQYWPSVPHVLIEPGVRTGIPLLVDNPKEVGADRIVNCLAAYHKHGGAAIVVDFGSSICVDVVSAKGEFLGGAIAPGVQISSDAAAARSAALLHVELSRPRSVVGKHTVDCTRAEVRAAHAALATDTATDDIVGVAGRVGFARNSGKLCFATLQDGDGTTLQVMISLDKAGQEALDAWKADVDLGDIVYVHGNVISSRRGELSVLADSWRMAAKSLRPLPVAHKEMSEESRVRQRYVDLIVRPQARAVARQRIAVVRALRSALERRGVLEVETPMLQTLAGGAAA